MFGKKPHRLYVFGGGPAGCLAALAGIEAGLDVVVFTAPGDDGKPRKSELFGCQYLHSPIPFYAEGPGTPIDYRLVGGTSDEYRRKVYGEGWDGSVSVDEYGPAQPHRAWDLRSAYDALWGSLMTKGIISATELSPRNVAPFYNDRQGVVISTIPAPALCLHPEEHKFITQEVWAMGSTPWRSLPYEPTANTVECNAADAPRWYRAASVFGHSTLEWPGGPKPPIAGIAAVSKPLGTDCDCWTGGRRWHKMGRYGAWQKGVLVHQVYEQAQAVLS